MSTYVKNSNVERTVYLTILGSPAVGILPADVSFYIKKAGQPTSQQVTLNGTNWIDVGYGFYTVILGAAETDTVGTLAYHASGSGFDNLVFDQVNIVEPTQYGNQAYYQDSPNERTIYLEKLGVPAVSVPVSSVTCEIKKSGQLQFYPKVLNAENWINLGGGYYSIKFSADDMSRVGTFTFKLSSTNFDNFLYDEFTILAAPDVTVKDKCVVKGQFIGLTGDMASQIRVSARLVAFPAKSGTRIVSGDTAFTFLNHEGKFELPLLRGATVIVEVPRAAIRHQVVIPDQPEVNLMDLLPPFAVDFSF